MQQIEFNGQSVDFPTEWKDVKPGILPQVIQLVFFAQPTKENSHELIRLTLGIRMSSWKKLMQVHFGPKVGKKAREANAVVLHTLKHELRWMHREPIHEQPFPAIKLGFLNELLLPETDFLSMSYGELTDAYIHFLVYIRQLVQGQHHLDLLVATLCRPERTGDYQTAPDWNGDRREPYNEFTAKERAKALTNLEPGFKMAVLLFFAGNMQRVLSRYAIFSDEQGEPELYPGQGWVKNSHLLASKGIFGNIDQTKAANLHDVLLYMEEHRKDLLAEIERRKQQESE